MLSVEAVQVRSIWLSLTLVAVRLVGVEGGVASGPVSLYSTRNSGAEAATPLNDSAIRDPDPVTMMAREFPGAQPGLETISWMIDERLGV